MLTRYVLASLAGVAVPAGAGCGNDVGAAAAPDAADQADPGPQTFTETLLTVVTKLTITPSPTPDTPPTVTLDITARDGTTPVLTDLWLYTIDATGAQVPLTGFTSTAQRRSPKLMLPALVKGQPSGYPHADDGRQNGLMTNTSRGTMRQGAFVPGITGTVVVTLPAVPVDPILVIAAIEDQRYAGAAVINPDGTPGVVPPGVIVAETHTRLSFERDVASITKPICGGCHRPSHTFVSRPGGTREELLTDNFGYSLGLRNCQRMHPGGGVVMDQCVQAITSASFMVEPGAPAVSSWLARARPDEDGNAAGVVWWGARGGVRYATDYGDHRMPSTTESVDALDWTNQPTDFDNDPAKYLIVWEWVAQGAAP